MRRLLQPEVMKAAGLAAGGTALACYPRLALWRAPVATWLLALVLLVESFLLWAIVFAWHTSFTGRPVLRRLDNLRDFLGATIAGLAVAAVLHCFLDATFRARTPADYPSSLQHWFAMTLFALAFHPLFLTFAPLAVGVRLFRKVWVASSLTVLFGVFVLLAKMQSAVSTAPVAVLTELVVLRLALGVLAVFFYLRGGVLLVWWWTFPLQARHLLTL